MTMHLPRYHWLLLGLVLALGIAAVAWVVHTQASAAMNPAAILDKRLFDEISRLGPFKSANHISGTRARGNVKEIRRCLDQGANPNLPNPSGHATGTPAGWSMLAMVVRNYHMNPEYAGAEDNLTAARLLLEHGADPNDTTARMPVLIHAYPHMPMVTLLLDHGADINIREQSNGRTVLMRAAFGYTNDDHALVKCLLERGANVNQRDNYGQSALDFAKVHPKENAETIAVLRQAGGKTGKEVAGAAQPPTSSTVRH